MTSRPSTGLAGRMTHQAPADPVRTPRPWRALLDWLWPVAAAFALVALVHTVLVQPFTIPSSSMAPDLLTGDYILVTKFSYGWSRASAPFVLPGRSGRLAGRLPRRGDVVVFRLPRDPSQVWVKRVIGLPGDQVRVVHGVVVVNGRPLPQTPLGAGTDADDPQRPVRRMRETGPDGRTRVIQRALVDGEGDDTGVYVTPPGNLFMMGDNRDDSADSRWPREVGVGFLPVDDVLGPARVVALSWRPGSALLKPWTWLNLRPDRFARPVT